MSIFLKPVVGLPVLMTGLVRAGVAKASLVCFGTDSEGNDLNTLQKRLYIAEKKQEVAEGKRMMREGIKLIAMAKDDAPVQAGLLSELDDYAVSMETLREIEAEAVETHLLRMQIEKIKKQQELMNLQLTYL